MTRFTVVTACRNAAATIERTLRSVATQRGVEVEHVVVDGNSTDGTLEILARNPDPRRVLVLGADQGIADAFNQGVARATGDVVAFLNADDWYATPDALVTVARHLRDDHTVVCGAIELHGTDGTVRRLASDPSRLRDGMYVRHPATFVPASLLRSVGPFDTRYRIAMDFDLVTRLAHAGASFVTIPDVITCMSAGGASADVQRMLREELDVKNRHHGRGARNLLHYLSSLAIARARGLLRRG